MKLLILALLSILTSCSSLTGTVAALNMASQVEYENPERPEFKYNKGDKIEFWNANYGPGDTCEVLYATSNPYSDQNMVAKYEIQCPDKFSPGGFNTRTITSKDLENNEYFKSVYIKAHPNWKKEIAEAEERAKPKYKPEYQIGETVTYYDTHEDTTTKCKVVKIDDPGLGKSQIGYILECPGYDDRVSAEPSLLKAGRKIASDRAAGKVVTREQSFKQTLKRTYEQRKQFLESIK